MAELPQVTQEIRTRLREHIRSQQQDPNKSPFGDGMVAGLELALRVIDDVMSQASKRSG